MMTVERVAAAMPDPVTQVINQAVLHRITVILIPRIRTTMLVVMPVLTKAMLTKTRAVESAMTLQGMTFRMPVKLPLRARTTQAVRIILQSRKQVVA